MTERPATDAPRLAVSPEVEELGLRHVRAWILAGDALTEPVLGAERAGELLGRLPAEDSRAGYRKLISVLGYPDTVPAGERLRELAATRPWQGHGGVIDAVTVASLVAGGGIGLHDAAGLEADATLTVRRSPGGERLVPAFSSRSRPIPEGDLTYGAWKADGAFEPFAWLGKRDADSATRQAGPASRRVCVVALGHPGDTEAHTAGVLTSVMTVLEALGIHAEAAALPTADSMPVG